MGYEDNPRKVYGRVDIVYSDAEISKDIRTAESDNAEISHPDEVHKGHESPTVKACTMDENATMDGSFQMMDDSCVCGWWTKAMADKDGVFIDTKPYIELSFVRRPVISWIVRGDDKLNQFPVDFFIDYKRGGKTILTETVTANTKLEVKLEPKLADIDAIRMTITKWSKSNACVKILQFYDKLYESYEGDAVQKFEVNEEMGSEEVSYNINSDTASVTLHNTDRKFDRGYLRSLLLLDRKITFSLGVEKDGKVEYTRLGQFYSDEWQVSQDSQWVQCQAVDKLIRLQDKEYVGFPLTENVSLKEIVQDLFDKLGYKSTDYAISDNLDDIIVPNAYLPKTTAWDALQEIANAGLCRVFVDRNDRVVVRSESDGRLMSDAEINASNMFSAKSNITLTEFANQIEAEYTEITLSEDIIDAVETTLILSPGESIILNLAYSTEIANAWIESDNASIRLTNFSSGVDACKVTATNVGGGYGTAKIKVTGNAIVENSRSVTVSDEDSIRSYGTTEYKHPSSELVQTEEHAEYIAFTLLKNMRAGEGVVTAVWRGTPDLELGVEFKYTDRFGDSRRLVCESNKFTFDGALKQETRGRKTKTGD